MLAWLASHACAPCKCSRAAARSSLALRLRAGWKPAASSGPAGCKLTWAAKLSARRCSAADASPTCCCCCGEALAAGSGSGSAYRVLAGAGDVCATEASAAGSANAISGSCCSSVEPAPCSSCCAALPSCRLAGSTLSSSEGTARCSAKNLPSCAASGAPSWPWQQLASAARRFPPAADLQLPGRLPAGAEQLHAVPAAVPAEVHDQPASP